jgi:hypothetical protein
MSPILFNMDGKASDSPGRSGEGRDPPGEQGRERLGRLRPGVVVTEVVAEGIETVGQQSSTRIPTSPRLRSAS